jgi:hypothetical protein
MYLRDNNLQSNKIMYSFCIERIEKMLVLVYNQIKVYF